MIEESCNLIGRKEILVDHLKLDVINDKMTLLFPWN